MLDPIFSTQPGLISNNASLNINGSKSNSASLKMKSCLKAIDFSLNMPMFPDNVYMAHRWKHK
jgi:hypothetical protein